MQSTTQITYVASLILPLSFFITVITEISDRSSSIIDTIVFQVKLAPVRLRVLHGLPLHVVVHGLQYPLQAWEHEAGAVRDRSKHRAEVLRLLDAEIARHEQIKATSTC